jgi:protein gp37
VVGEFSGISWTDHTFNPWVGCMKVGPGCDNCYAEAMDARYAPKGETVAPHWGPGAPRRRTVPSNWAKPLKWDRDAKKAGIRYRVFCASLADVFDNEVDEEWRADLFKLIAETPHLDWMLLTKRIGNVRGMLPDDWGHGWPNVWIGATIVNQAEADRDIPKLLRVPAMIRWLSMEPLLEPVDLTRLPGSDAAPVGPPVPSSRFDALTGQRWFLNTGNFRRVPLDEPGPAIDWVIVGGESGPGARTMDLDWARAIGQQCKASGVAFHFKQMSEANHPRVYANPEHFPHDLQVREFPV